MCTLCMYTSGCIQTRQSDKCDFMSFFFIFIKGIYSTSGWMPPHTPQPNTPECCYPPRIISSLDQLIFQAPSLPSGMKKRTKHKPYFISLIVVSQMLAHRKLTAACLIRIDDNSHPVSSKHIKPPQQTPPSRIPLPLIKDTTTHSSASLISGLFCSSGPRRNRVAVHCQSPWLCY